jgi:hypothetical protein
MQTVKNQEKRSEIYEGVFQGLRVTGSVVGATNSVSLTRNDIDLADISIEIRKILPSGEKKEVYVGDYLRLFKHLTVIQNRVHDDFIHSTALVATNLVGGSKYEYFCPLSIKFPTPIAGKFEVTVQLKNTFLANCDAISSHISFELDQSDDVAEYDLYIGVESLNSGQSTMSKMLGDGIFDITLTGYSSNQNNLTEGTKNFNKVTLSSTYQSWSKGFKEICNASLMEQMDFMGDFPTSMATRYNNRDLILHTGEILGNVNLNIDLVAGNIVGEDSVVYTKLLPLDDSFVHQQGLYLEKKNKLTSGRV